MIKQIQFGNGAYFTGLIEDSLFGLIQNEPMKSFKEFIVDIFSRLAAFFRSFNSQSKEMNLKPIAMISCLSLVTLLVISIFRRREESIIPPPTPMKGTEVKV